MVSKVKVERFSMTSSRSFNEVLAAISDPVGHPGRSDEVAKAVVFLACDDSSYITGAEVFVDGGFAQV